MPEEPAPVEKALALLVYAPLGFALYARDTLPSLVGLFAARGKRELQSGGGPVERTVEQARTISGTVLGAAAAPDVRRRVEGSFDVARDVATGAFGSLLAWRAAAPAPAPAAPTAPVPPTAPVAPTTPVAPAVSVPIEYATPSAPPAAAPAVSLPSQPPVEVEPQAPLDPGLTPPIGRGPAGGLAIPDYDELSASQVVDRLEGLTPPELDAIRVYEIANRGRNTILGKIAQLTR